MSINELWYEPEEFVRIIEVYLDAKGYEYCAVVLDKQNNEQFSFNVVEGLCTKTWGYEKFLYDFECREDEKHEYDYQDTILGELYGPLGNVEYIKEDKKIKVSFFRPNVNR